MQLTGHTYIGPADLGRALGRVLAHEIGHVVLGAHVHQARGLMRAVFLANDLIAHEHQSYYLSSAELARLRDREAELTLPLELETVGAIDLFVQLPHLILQQAAQDLGFVAAQFDRHDASGTSDTITALPTIAQARACVSRRSVTKLIRTIDVIFSARRVHEPIRLRTSARSRGASRRDHPIVS
jgi:hypothetical protein